MEKKDAKKPMTAAEALKAALAKKAGAKPADAASAAADKAKAA